MEPRLEKIKSINEVLNHSNPTWKEEIDWLIKQVENLHEIRGIVANAHQENLEKKDKEIKFWKDLAESCECNI